MSEIGFPEASRPGEQPKITKLSDFSAEALGQLVQWLNTQLEVPINQIIGYSTAIFPTGTILMTALDTADDGWLLCDGSVVAQAAYPSLFLKIGAKYNTGGEAGTDFRLPDYRGRVAVGKGTNAAVNAIGNSDGVAVGNRRPQHRHTPHSHLMNSNVVGGNASAQVGASAIPPNNTATSSVDGGSGNANDALDAPAYLVTNFQIKT